ncbi:MAG: hypothetical protein WA821_14090 [Anaerolineales bacterium]
MNNKKIEIAILVIGLLLSGFTCLFGDNIYKQLTGHSFAESQSTQTPIFVIVTATVPQVVNQPTVTIYSQATDTLQPAVDETHLSPTNVSQLSTLSCLSTQYSSLGKGWTSEAMFLPTRKGATRIFTHCPPMTTIQYDSIAVDDEITKVELVCSDSTIDISSLFIPYKVPNQILLFWRSSRIELKQNCRIDFTIHDTQGDQIGLMIKESEP